MSIIANNDNIKSTMTRRTIRADLINRRDRQVTLAKLGAIDEILSGLTEGCNEKILESCPTVFRTFLPNLPSIKGLDLVKVFEHCLTDGWQGLRDGRNASSILDEYLKKYQCGDLRNALTQQLHRPHNVRRLNRLVRSVLDNVWDSNQELNLKFPDTLFTTPVGEEERRSLHFALLRRFARHFYGRTLSDRLSAVLPIAISELALWCVNFESAPPYDRFGIKLRSLSSLFAVEAFREIAELHVQSNLIASFEERIWACKHSGLKNNLVHEYLGLIELDQEHEAYTDCKSGRAGSSEIEHPVDKPLIIAEESIEEVTTVTKTTKRSRQIIVNITPAFKRNATILFKRSLEELKYTPTEKRLFGEIIQGDSTFGDLFFRNVIDNTIDDMFKSMRLERIKSIAQELLKIEEESLSRMRTKASLVEFISKEVRFKHDI